MTPIGHWMFGLNKIDDALLIIAAIIIVVLLIIIYMLVKRLRHRSSYNLEYPADFYSSADLDAEDRNAINRHFK